MLDLVVSFQSELLFDHVPDFFVIAESVYHLAGLQELAVFKYHQTVSIMVQRILVDAAALADVGKHLLPESGYVSGNLLAVGIAHLVLGIHFCEALVLAHLYDIEMNAKLSCHILYILCL